MAKYVLCLICLLEFSCKAWYRWGFVLFSIINSCIVHHLFCNVPVLLQGRAPGFEKEAMFGVIIGVQLIVW